MEGDISLLPHHRLLDKKSLSQIGQGASSGSLVATEYRRRNTQFSWVKNKIAFFAK
jgi:hypothetical protein